MQTRNKIFDAVSAAYHFDLATLYIEDETVRCETDPDFGLPLRDFVNEFGERFEAGGFFATERPDPLLLVQYESRGRLWSLVVIGHTTQ